MLANSIMAAPLSITAGGAGPVRVLLVEDDRLLRQLAVETLLDEGIEAVGLERAADALRYLQEALGIELLITDINMPGMNGLELAALVHRAFPHIRLLVISGRDRPAADPAAPPWQFLPKPFSATGFLTRVRELLGP